MVQITSMVLTISETIWLLHPEQCVQRQLNFAIIDEVDNILVDEARTPLIISGQVAAFKQRI